MKLSLNMATLGLVSLFGVGTAVASDVLTNHNNVARTGLVSDETVLTPANVAGLKILFQKTLDGQVYAQPLCIANQLVYKNGVSQGKRNVVIVATEHGSSMHSTQRAAFVIGRFRCLTKGIVLSKPLTGISIATNWRRKSVLPRRR